MIKTFASILLTTASLNYWQDPRGTEVRTEVLEKEAHTKNRDSTLPQRFL